MHAITRTLYTGRTKFQEVGIIESPVYGKILLLDGDMQSGQCDEFIYHEALVHPALVSHPNPQRVLILGGGEGATLREVANHKGIEEIYMLDIDGELLELCKEYLPEFSRGAFSDPRLKLHCVDANQWMRNTELTFDVIISDLTEPYPYSPSNEMFSVEFFKILRSRLNKPGIFAMQASRGDMLELAVHSCLYKTLREAFSIVRSYSARIPSYDFVWAYLFASEDIDPLDIESDTIDQSLGTRLRSELLFYDGETHRGLFSLPKYFRKARDEQGSIMVNGELPVISEKPRYLL